ncbi:zinc finger protein ZFP2-like isoform X2 [Armigeres subalbatus]
MDQTIEQTFEVKQEPVENNYSSAISEDVCLLNQFCRLCLQNSSVSFNLELTIRQMFQSVTGLELVVEDKLPTKVCQSCKNSLETAYNIRQCFIESYRKLQSFSYVKTRTMIDQLLEYQQEAELVLEKQPVTDTVYCPPVEDGHIKQEPELDLEPEAPPDPEPTKSRKRNRYNRKIKQAKLDPNKCYICQETFENAQSLEVHLPAHVEMIPYHCEECGNGSDQPVKITSLIVLHKHFRMHASAIKCTKCPFRSCTMVAMYGHMQIYHGENSDTEYTCETCGVKLVNKATLDRHMRFHKARDEGRYTCLMCDKKFATKTHLIRHERSHTNERPFKCHFCPNSYKTQSVRNRHERTHTGEKGFGCDICGKRYRLQSVLKSHIASIHEEPKIPEGPLPILSCDVEGCSYTTTKKGAFYNHKAIHQLKFQCLLCPKRFATGQRLEMHQFVHTGVKKFQCKQCPKSFLSKFTLDQHEAAHTNTTPFPCEICGKIFMRQRSLKQHLLKHTDFTMNFECGHCSKKFKYRAELVRHEKTHKKATTTAGANIENIDSVIVKQETEQN